MVFDMSWFGSWPGPAPHPRLTRISRWSAPHPWDSFVAGCCSYFCFLGPVVVFALSLAPFLFAPLLLIFAPFLLSLYWTLEAAWFVHRWYLRYKNEPYTAPPSNPDRKIHMARFLKLKNDCVPSFHEYLRCWFRGADPQQIKRENLREFVRYGFYGQTDADKVSVEDELEIEQWIVSVEKTWQITFEPGRTKGLKSMKHMREPLRVFHTPLFIVAYSHAVEHFGGYVLRCWGFKKHACGDTGVVYWLRGGKNNDTKRKKASASRSNSNEASPSRERHALSSLEDEDDVSDSKDKSVWCRECGSDAKKDSGGLLKPLRRSLDLLRRMSGDTPEGSPERNSGDVNPNHDSRHHDTRRCFAGCRPPPPPPPERDPSTPTWAPSPKRKAEPTPFVLLHGLGIGLPPYLWFVANIQRARRDRPIALVCLPEVSLRAVFKVPSPDDLVDAVETLCRKHELYAPCLLGHSFGTFVVARACQRSRVASAVLIDPVASCLMLPAVISKVLYQLEDRWRELWGLPKAGATGGGGVGGGGVGGGGSSNGGSTEGSTESSTEGSTPSRQIPRRGILHPRSSWRHRVDLISKFLFTLCRDCVVVRELSCAVALSRKFWWYQVCLWAEDMPRRSLVVLQSYDAILDPDAIASHLINRDAADVVWVEGFQHGELLGPQGYEARRMVVGFLQTLDTERMARDLIGLEQTSINRCVRKSKKDNTSLSRKNNASFLRRPPLAPDANGNSRAA